MGKNLSFAARIIAGFLVMALVLLVVSLKASFTLQRTHDEVEILADKYMKFSQHIQAVQLSTINLRRYEKDLFIHMANKAKQKDYLDRWSSSLARARNELQQANTIAAGDGELKEAKTQGLNLVAQKIAYYEKGFLAVAAQVESGTITSTVDADAAIEQYKVAISDAEKTINALVDSINREADELQTEVTDSTEAASNWMLLISAAGLVLSVIIAVMVVISIRRPLQTIGKLAKQLADERDLTLSLPDFGKNEIGQVGTSLNNLITTVRSLIAESHDHSARLVEAAGQLSTVNAELTRSSESQSEATSNSAAAIEQLTVSISHMADNAKSVESQSTQATAAAEQGLVLANNTALQIEAIAQSLSRTATTIDSLNERSGEIDGIVRVIRDIAEQTNLLALNAAIEAARAGETGRGFAVVADEVRKLAERTSQATSEINDRIQGVQQDTTSAYGSMQEANKLIEVGVTETHNVSKALSDIRQLSATAEQKVLEMSSAIQEQSYASQDIASNVERIASMNADTQRSVNDAASLALQLTKQSAELDASLARFRI